MYFKEKLRVEERRRILKRKQQEILEKRAKRRRKSAEISIAGVRFLKEAFCVTLLSATLRDLLFEGSSRRRRRSGNGLRLC